MSATFHPMKRVLSAYGRGVRIPKGHVRFECQADGCRWFVEAWRFEGRKAMTYAAESIREHKRERKRMSTSTGDQK